MNSENPFIKHKNINSIIEAVVMSINEIGAKDIFVGKHSIQRGLDSSAPISFVISLEVSPYLGELILCFPESGLLQIYNLAAGASVNELTEEIRFIAEDICTLTHSKLTDSFKNSEVPLNVSRPKSREMGTLCKAGSQVPALVFPISWKNDVLMRASLLVS